ncbi:MAG: ATP-binding protein [Pseudomonadota bacterium]|nr:ATP-binding protein [Pseudomonadota bacterium]
MHTGTPTALRPPAVWQRLIEALRGLPVTDADPAVQREVEQQALDLLAKGMRATLVTALIGVPLAAWLLQDFIGPAWAWGTAALMALVHLERLRHLRQMARLPVALRGDPRRWAHAMIWRVALTAVLFNGWSLPAIESTQFMATVYIICIVLMVATSSMTQYCAWPLAVWVFVTPLLLGPAWQLWSVPDEHGDGRLAGAVFMIALWAMLLAASARFSRAMQNDLLTRLRNERLMRELDEKRQQAEAANAAKTRFLAAASHDLRQPVHAMALLGEALRAQLAGTPQEPLARQMVAGVANFTDLVDEVMDLASIDAGALSAHPVAVNASALLARADAAFRASAAARGLALWLRLPMGGDAPWLLADPALLWRVVGNLLSNAVRYTARGGVMLTVRRARLHGQPAWRIEVRDSGPGIAEHQREAIFEEFYQAHNPHRSRSVNEGRGLGLAVAQRMAALMGTRVRLHPASARGPGAVFSITLPAASMPPAAPGGDAAPATASPTPPLPTLPLLRVLVVDDDAAVRSALLALLHGWGLPAEAAPDAAGAAHAAQRAAQAGQPVQVLITDHWLARGELSTDVLAAVRPHAPDARIAIVSGGAAASEVSAVAQGRARFMQKPVRPAALRAWLAECGPALPPSL